MNRLSDTQFRVLGVLPLIFFLGQAIHYWRINEVGHVLWMCNIGNLMLAAGLFLNHALMIRVAVIWTIPGLFVWLIYAVLAWGVFLTSTLAHVGGIIVGLLVIRRVGMDRVAWAYALFWYLLVQLASRLVTPRELNVNVAHAMDPGWQHTFGSYWKFWLVLTVVTACVLWTIGLALNKLWPAEAELRSTLSFRRGTKAR